MPLIKATWQVTFGSGLKLLETGDFMNTEPRIVPAGKTQASNPAGAAYATERPLGGVTHTVTFSRVKIFATDQEARDFLGTEVARTPVCRELGVLTIELLRAGTLTLAGAVIRSMGEPTTENCRFLADYTIVGGAMVHTGGPDAPTGEPWVPPPTPILEVSPGHHLDVGDGAGLDMS